MQQATAVGDAGGKEVRALRFGCRAHYGFGALANACLIDWGEILNFTIDPGHEIRRMNDPEFFSVGARAGNTIKFACFAGSVF
jgi:hypothetical protein